MQVEDWEDISDSAEKHVVIQDQRVRDGSRNRKAGIVASGQSNLRSRKRPYQQEGGSGDDDNANKDEDSDFEGEHTEVEDVKDFQDDETEDEE